MVFFLAKKTKELARCAYILCSAGTSSYCSCARSCIFLHAEVVDDMRPASPLRSGSALALWSPVGVVQGRQHSSQPRAGRCLPLAVLPLKRTTRTHSLSISVLSLCSARFVLRSLSLSLHRSPGCPTRLSKCLSHALLSSRRGQVTLGYWDRWLDVCDGGAAEEALALRHAPEAKL